MPARHTEFTERFDRVARRLGYVQRTGKLDCPKITELVRLRNGFRRGEWSEQRVYRIATGRLEPKWSDVRALATGLEVEDWQLLRDKKRRRRRREGSVIEELMGL